jgi:hypothetical protein
MFIGDKPNDVPGCMRTPSAINFYTDASVASKSEQMAYVCGISSSGG